MTHTCQELLLSSLTDYYNDNPENKLILKDIISGKHILSLRMIDWLVTHYSKSHNTIYWTHYRAQLKSYAKINIDSFRRHNRISFIIDFETNDFIETTVGQLNFFRWAFNNNVLSFAMKHYDEIHENMVINNSYKKEKKVKQPHKNIQDITRTMCTLRFD